MLWLCYEDTISDPVKTVTQIKDFLFADDGAAEAKLDVERVVELSKFESVKQELEVCWDILLYDVVYV